MVDSETIRQEALRLLAVLLTNETVPLSKELAGVPVFAVITFAFSYALSLDPILASEPAETEDGADLLAELPEGLQTALRQYLQEDPAMPVEFLVELAIAHFLDPDCNTFNDCIIWPQRERMELLQEAVANRGILAD